MSTGPAQRYIIKRVDGFVCVCDTQDNEAPIDNSAKGLEALLNALNTAGRFDRIHDLNQMGGQCEEIARLQAEVERLRKAGDAMERSLAFEYPDSPKVKEWNAAKEGKESV